jgi:hypothetical protein
MRALLRCLAATYAFAMLAAPSFAQDGGRSDGALGKDEAKVRWVDGRPMLRVTLRAGDNVYYCHLLIDLSTSLSLYLHRNAAGSLKAEACSVEAGGIQLADLGFEAKRDTWLEGLTSEYAEELQQVPVAGILGLRAFGDHDVVLDGPNSVLRLLPSTSATAEAPPASEALSAISFVGDVQRGIRLRCELGDGAVVDLTLHTRDPFSWLDPRLCRKVGHPDGVLQTVVAGEFLDFAKWAPFRPLRSQSEIQGGIGGAVLRQMVVTVQPAAGRVVFGMPAAPVYPEVEAQFYRAVFGTKDTAVLRKFVEEHADTPQAAEAASALLERELEQDGDLGALQVAGLAIVRTAAKNKKGTAALDVLEHLPATREAFAARAAIAEAGLAEARADEDGNAAHKLRLELGTQKRILGDLKEARRHLLSAVFGMPASGPANLQLGHWHRDQGELDAALGRYFLALLDMKNTGQEGYLAFAQVFARLHGSEDGLLAELEDRADGRVPSFQPIPRDPTTIHKTGRTVLVELFTGAMCPPCVAADVGCDGLSQLYDRDEVVVVQWHLPVPQPEPMVAPASLERAEKYGVSSTPTVVIAGGEPIVGGGKVDAAPDMFRRYREVVDAQLLAAPVASIEGSASCTGSVVRVVASVMPVATAKPDRWRVHAVLVESMVAFPGGNGMLFHHGVARSAFTPPGGAPIGQATSAQPLDLTIELGSVEAELDEQVATYETDKVFLVRPVRPERTRLEVVLFVQDEAGVVVQAKRLPVKIEVAK